MVMNCSRKALVAVLGIGALLASGLVGTAAAKPSGDPVKVGVIYLTGVAGLDLGNILTGA